MYIPINKTKNIYIFRNDNYFNFQKANNLFSIHLLLKYSLYVFVLMYVLLCFKL